MCRCPGFIFNPGGPGVLGVAVITAIQCVINSEGLLQPSCRRVGEGIPLIIKSSMIIGPFAYSTLKERCTTNSVSMLKRLVLFKLMLIPDINYITNKLPAYANPLPKRTPTHPQAAISLLPLTIPHQYLCYQHQQPPILLP